MSQKKYVFKIDRLLYLFYLSSLILIMIKSLSDIKSFNDFLDGILLIILIVLGFIFVNIFSKSKYNIENGYLYRSGLIKGSTIEFSKIQKISINPKNIVIEYINYDSKESLKMRVYLLENNLIDARELLSQIVEAIGDESKVDSSLLEFINGNTESICDKKYNTISGSIILLLIALIFFIMSEAIYLPTLAIVLILKFHIYFALQATVLLIYIVWGIIAVISLLRKKKKAIKIIISFRIFAVISAFVEAVLAYLMQRNLDYITIDYSVLRLSLDVLVVICITMSILRFMKISTRVKKTLIK